MSRRNSPAATAAELAALTMRGWTLWAEASMVVGMRMMGMAGLWAVRPDETVRMVTEKAPAFSEAAVAGTAAAMRGKRPDQIATAAMAPLTRAARANRRRLVKRGPKVK